MRRGESYRLRLYARVMRPTRIHLWVDKILSYFHRNAVLYGLDEVKIISPYIFPVRSRFYVKTLFILGSSSRVYSYDNRGEK